MSNFKEGDFVRYYDSHVIGVVFLDPRSFNLNMTCMELINYDGADMPKEFPYTPQYTGTFWGYPDLYKNLKKIPSVYIPERLRLMLRNPLSRDMAIEIVNNQYLKNYEVE